MFLASYITNASDICRRSALMSLADAFCIYCFSVVVATTTWYFDISVCQWQDDDISHTTQLHRIPTLTVVVCVLSPRCVALPIGVVGLWNLPAADEGAFKSDMNLLTSHVYLSYNKGDGVTAGSVRSSHQTVSGASKN